MYYKKIDGQVFVLLRYITKPPIHTIHSKMSAGFKTDLIIHDATEEDIKKATKHSIKKPIKVTGKIGAESTTVEVYGQHNGHRTTHLYQDEIAEMKNCAKLILKKEDTKKKLQYNLLHKKMSLLKDNATINEQEFTELCDLIKKVLPKDESVEDFFAHFGIGFALGDA